MSPPCAPAVLTGVSPDRLPLTLHAVLADRRCRPSEPVHRARRLRVRKRVAVRLPECIHVSTKPLLRRANPAPLLFRASRGTSGAWQRFERGELPLLHFYTAFGRDLSDTTNGNIWYTEYCRRKGLGMYNSWASGLPGLISPSVCPQLPEQLQIDGRDVSILRDGGSTMKRAPLAVWAHDAISNILRRPYTHCHHKSSR